MANSNYISRLKRSAVPGINDFLQLVKFRLTIMVVFSSAMGYLAGMHEGFLMGDFIILVIAGFLVTGSANGINQVLERTRDSLMARTADRPVASGRLSNHEAIIITTIMGISGIFLLGFSLHPLAGWLGFAALVMYAFIYTPLKRISSWNVLPGAIAGSLPILIGYVVGAGSIDLVGIFLFEILFVWQFPHTWIIGWLQADDYKKAGFRMTPFNCGKSRSTAVFILAASFILFTIPLGPMAFGWVDLLPGSIVLLLAGYIVWQSYKLVLSKTDMQAKKVMLAALLYLPLALILLVIGLA